MSTPPPPPQYVRGLHMLRGTTRGEGPTTTVEDVVVVDLSYPSEHEPTPYLPAPEGFFEEHEREDPIEGSAVAFGRQILIPSQRDTPLRIEND